MSSFSSNPDQRKFAVHVIDDRDLSKDELYSILNLINLTWPNKEKTVDEQVHEHYETLHDAKSEKIKIKFNRFIIWDKEEVIANAETFSRMINTPIGNLEVMALAGVCVKENLRKKGVGTIVVKRAFERVDDEEFVVSLFQTGIPNYYKKFGAKTIYNHFYNTQNRNNINSNPWWDGHVMIYPSSFLWPEGKIDLKGKGF